MGKIVKELIYNTNRNNTNGAFAIDNLKIFYKILTKDNYYDEIEGYDILSEFYNVPKRYFYIDNQNINIVGYEYHDCELLVDYFSKKEFIDNGYISILQMYFSIFKNTIKYNKKGNCRIFFENRLTNRLFDNVNNERVRLLENSNVILNDKIVLINTGKIYNDVVDYFNHEQKSWNIISNCDPNDMNICLDGILFDYTAGGYVPLMCELAVFICYNLIQGEYLALKYNRKAFSEHKDIYIKMNKVNYHKNVMYHIPRKIRINAVIKYFEFVILPLMKKIEYKDWYDDFKNYFVMKLLAVFDFKNMSNKDIDLSLAYANLFYNNNFKKIDELKKFIIDLYGGGYNDLS